MVSPLERILIIQNVLTPQELETLKSDAQSAGTNLFEEIKKKVPAESLADYIAQAYNCPSIKSISEDMTDPVLLGKIPFRFLKDNCIILIQYEGQLTLITTNPGLFQPIDELNLLLKQQTTTGVATEKTILDALNRFYPLEGTKQMLEELGAERELGDETLEFGEIDERDILGMANEAPIIKLVNGILFQAVKRGASDIHIEPYEKEIAVRFRIDGVMQVAYNPPKRIQGALISRIKIMANMNIAEKRKPQGGRIQIKVGDKAIDIRVSALPVSFGEKIVMRLLDKSKSFNKLEDLGLSKRDAHEIIKNIEAPNGIILLTGPTGSGKTSTLYAILSRLNRPEVSIVTVEDPVEYQMSGISQVQVNDKVGLSFAAALREILRQDPDIIMIGETRDTETAQIAIQASLTGHLVLSTLHTNSAPASITRLIDMGIEPFLIASSITCIVAQRLVRKLCPLCKKPYKPDAAILKSIGLTEQEAAKITFFKPVGCNECTGGYRGRLPIFEVMSMTPNIAQLTMERADASIIKNAAVKDGMTLLVQDGVDKIIQGLTTIDEVLSVANATQDFE
jgi:general secretion pathway protein E